MQLVRSSDRLPLLPASDSLARFVPCAHHIARLTRCTPNKHRTPPKARLTIGWVYSYRRRIGGVEKITARMKRHAIEVSTIPANMDARIACELSGRTANAKMLAKKRLFSGWQDQSPVRARNSYLRTCSK